MNRIQYIALQIRARLNGGLQISVMDVLDGIETAHHNHKKPDEHAILICIEEACRKRLRAECQLNQRIKEMNDVDCTAA